MALSTEHQSEYKRYQTFFRLIGFFPFKFETKRLFWLKLYQRVLYCLLLPLAFAAILIYTKETSDKSYINRLAKKCILYMGFTTLWVNLFEADVTSRDQAIIFSKLEEIKFVAWTAPKSSRIGRMMTYLILYNTLNWLLAIGNEFLSLNILSRVINLWIQFRAIQLYFFKRSINEKLELIKPVRGASEHSIFDVKNERLYYNVEKMKRALLKIREINFYLNKCIGWSLLFIIMHWFLVFTCHLYWLFLIVKSGFNDFSFMANISAIFPKVGLLYVVAMEIYKTNQHVSKDKVMKTGL